MTRPRLIIVGPLPPPTHGVTISTSLVLKNRLLSDRFRIEHVDTSDHRSAANIGKWDPTNLLLGTRHLVRMLTRTRGEKGIVYLPLSQNRAGFLRDALFILIAQRAGWKTAVHLRGGEFLRFYEEQREPLQRWIRGTLTRVTSAAVMGERLRDQFAGLLESDRVAVVPNGTPDLDPDGRRPENVVLFLSNLRRRKGIGAAFAAAEKVVRAEPSCRFLFVGEWGDPQLEREIRERARSYDGSIEFRPPVTGDVKRDLLLSSSVMLFPPIEPEGHPRVVLEALSAGLPVVTTNQGAIAETVVEGECGFVLDAPRPEDLAERLLLLLRNEPLRERMSAAARARYLSSFTQDHADKLLADWLARVSSFEESGPTRHARLNVRQGQ